VFVVKKNRMYTMDEIVGIIRDCGSIRKYEILIENNRNMPDNNAVVTALAGEVSDEEREKIETGFLLRAYHECSKRGFIDDVMTSEKFVEKYASEFKAVEINNKRTSK